MEQISEGFKNDLIGKYKSEDKIKSYVQNYEIYYFREFNVSNVCKLFNISTQKMFAEPNAKKNLNKVVDMIKSNFFSDKTNHYFNLFFMPTNNLSLYNKRKDALKKINFDFDKLDLNNIKTVLHKLDPVMEKVVFSQRLITLDGFTEKYLYDKYKINIELVNKSELEAIFSQEIVDEFVIISEEDLYTEVSTYKLKEFEKIIFGAIIKNNKEKVKELLQLVLSLDNYEEICGFAKEISGIDLVSKFDFEKLLESLEVDNLSSLKELTNDVLHLDSKVNELNGQLKTKLSNKELSLKGNELLELLNSGNLEAIQLKIKADVAKEIGEFERGELEKYKAHGLKIDCLFSTTSYPVCLDEDVKDILFKQIDIRSSELEFETYEKFSKFDLFEVRKLWNFVYFFDLILGIKKFEKNYRLNLPQINNSLNLIDCNNIYITNPLPINYHLGLEDVKVSVLTGANSGGKTTLLEMILQSQILMSLGLGISANSESTVRFFDEIIYLKKFTGTVGSGAFEQTIRNLIDILNSESSKLILIDEFEAITEPGAAARILIMFLREIMKQDVFCVAVSHLGQEIQEFILEDNVSGIRIDGISAEGLDDKGNLITNHQPKFNQLGKSTPELILKRILQDESFWVGKGDHAKVILENILK